MGVSLTLERRQICILNLTSGMPQVECGPKWSSAQQQREATAARQQHTTSYNEGDAEEKEKGERKKKGERDMCWKVENKIGDEDREETKEKGKVEVDEEGRQKERRKVVQNVMSWMDGREGKERRRIGTRKLE